MKLTRNIFNYFFAVMLVIACFACKKKYDGTSSLENLKYTNNSTTYAPIELDSIQARNTITRQKLQDVFDLATNYTSGNRDSEIDQLLYKQLEEYFEKPDSIKMTKVLKELDSLKARFVKINDVSTFKVITKKDTLDFAKYKMDFFDKDKKFLGTKDKQAQYVLIETPAKEQKFKSEFKFYFVNLNATQPKKDSIPSGKTK